MADADQARQSEVLAQLMLTKAVQGTQHSCSPRVNLLVLEWKPCPAKHKDLGPLQIANFHNTANFFGALSLCFFPGLTFASC